MKKEFQFSSKKDSVCIKIIGEELKMKKLANLIIELKNRVMRRIDEERLSGYRKKFNSPGSKFEKNFEKFEKEFRREIRKKRGLVIRLDLTNKCNLQCFYCHHKLPEFAKIPAKRLTKQDIECLLKNTGKYVEEIMLSCGHEPLISSEFSEIIGHISDNYPRVKINFCTNAMLLNAEIRRTVVQKQVHSFVFSMDGITKGTYERIRKGGNFEKVVGNILALKELKQEMNTHFPMVNLTFVMMNSNIHEAPYFPEVCNLLGINYISFQHVVGTDFLDMREETLFNHKEKFNYYRKKIIEKAREFKIPISIPDEFKTDELWDPKNERIVKTNEILEVEKDRNKIAGNKKLIKKDYLQRDNLMFDILHPFCKSPFREIMIIEQEVIKPCPFFSGPPLGSLKDKEPLLKIFFGEEFKKIRKNMFKQEGDPRCKDCPIKNSYLPKESDFKNPL